MDIKDIQGNIILSVSVSRECEHVEELMKSDYIQLSWNSSSRDILPAGSYIEYKGEKYSLLEPYSPTQKDELEFTYQPQFQSKIMIWGKTPFFMYTYVDDTISNREPDWSLTDNPANFMSVVVDAIKNETGETWTYSVGDSLPASTSLSFQTTDIFSALNQIANAFETEWWVDKINKVIHLSKASHGETVALEVGNNVKTPSVTYGKEGYYTRFYAFGSTRNIVQDYKGSNVNNLVNKRLTLDPDKYPGGYKDIRDNLSSDEIFSKVLIFDDIYPFSQLKISDVRMRLMWTLDSEGNKVQVGTNEEGAPIYDQYAIWYFQIPDFIFDNTIYDKDANPQGMLISGKKLSVHFQDGPLSGREFELNYHDKSEAVSSADGTPIQIKEGDYEILFVKEDSLVIPMINNLVPVDGNEIILFNIRMPEEYTASAYLELEATLSREMERMSSDLNNYQFSSNPIAFKEYNPNLSLGRNVIYKNGNYSYPTRVIKLVTKLDFEIEQTITVGNEQIKGNTQEIKEEVASANEDINLLAILNSTTNSLTQAYNRTQQLMLEGFASIKDMWKFDPNNADTIYSKYNVYSEKALSAKGLALGSGGSSGEGGATALYQLNDVAKNASETGVLGAGPGKVLTYGNDGKWYAADAVGLDETALGKYLTDNNYAQKSDIPSLSGYATQSWVLGKNYITSDALSGYATQSWVNSQGYATASSLKAVSDKLNDFLEGSDTDGIINKWKELEAFLAGQTQTSTLADLLAVKADKATTLSGYGITDAYTKTEVNTKLGSYVTTTALNTALAKKVDVAFLAKVFGFIGEDSSEVSINDMGSVITSIKAKFGLWTDEYLSSKGLNPNAGGGSGEGATALYQLNDVSQNASGTGVLGAETGKVLTYGSDGKWYAAKAGMDEDALSSYLTENNYAQKSDIPSLNGYATQSWVNTALEKKVDKVSGMGLSHNDFTDTLLQKLNGIAEGANKYILPIAKAAVLGGVMIGSTLTASATGVLDLPEVAVAGTYAKVTTDVYGRVTAGSSLSASDIPALGISKITGLQAALDDKVNKADFVTEFDKAMQRWFVRDTANKGLHPADYDSEAVGIYSDSYMSAKGVNTGAGGSAGGASSLGELNNVGSWADDIPTVDRIMVQRKGATHWESLNLSDIGLNETQLSDYLTTNNYAKKSDIPSLSGYATQAWVNTKLADYATTSSVTTLLAEKVDKVEGKGLSANDFTDTLLNKLNGIEAGANKYVLPTASGSVLGGVKVGTTLSIANGVLNLKSGIATAGTYTKVTVDTYGRITAGTTLIASDIPTLAISKITGLQNALDQKMDISDFQSKFNAAIASWFVRDTENKGIRPADHNSEPVGFYTNSYISSKGINTGSGGGISDYDRLDSWDDYSTDKSGYVLSAGLGWDLNTRVSSLESKAITLTTSGTGNGLSGFTQNGNTVTFSKATFLTEHQSLAGYATESWVNNKGYLVATSADKANWNTAFGWGDHSKAGYATQLWVTSKDYATIADLDARINALVNGAPEAFDTLKEIADVLQGNVNQIEDLLTAIGTKADKTITISAGTGLNGGGTLAANRTINLSAATTKALGGIIVGDRLSIDSDGKLSATYTYTLPTASASVLGGVKVGTTLAISSGVLNLKAVGTAGTYFKTTTDAYGRVTAGSNPTTLAGFGITDGVNDVAYSGSGNAVTSATVSGHIITLVKGTTFLTKATFDDLFEKVNIGTASAPVYAIKAKYGLYTEQFLSSMGLNLGTGSGGGSDYDRLDTWTDYDASKAGWVLSAGLGNDLNTRVTSLENGAAVTVTPSGSGMVVKDVTKNGTVITVTKGDLAFGSLTGKPTTIAGYGITNAYTKTESDGKYPLKAGTGATGTWGIDVTGYSKRLYANQDNAVANTLMQGSGLYYNQVSSTTDTGYPSNYGHTIRWQRSTSSTLSSSQAVVDLFHATGASALNQLYLRTGYGDGSKMVWGSFVQLLHTGNYTSLITKLGTATVGSNTKFFYLNAGTPTASTATVGSSSLPVYMNAGTITQCSTTLGVSVTGYSKRLLETVLTNEDLDTYTYSSYSGRTYSAGGGNTVANKPEGVDSFGLLVLRSAGGYTTHLAVNGANLFTRYHNSTTWSDWYKFAFVTSNVASATKLQTARTINGTSFDGTANITTANWGTARNFTIGAATKSVNGSAAVSFNLNEINAAYGRNVTYTGTTTAQGWYRLASTGQNINTTNSLFFISVTVSGQHSTFLLQVSTNYASNPSLIQLGGSNYSTASIDQFRLVYHTTYSGNYAYLEARSRGAMTSATFNVFLVGRANTTWNLSTALTAGSIPEGYTSKTLTPASASIVAPTFRGALVGNVTGNVTGNLTGNASTATSLQTARTLWGQSFNGTANITGTLLGVESLVARSGRINNFSGYFDNSGNPATGTICITLPNGWTSSMNIYEIWIYEYNTTANASVITIGAYNYNGGGTASSAKWVNIGYHTKGAYSKGVRLAYNGSKCVILLGTTATTWYYPKVYLKTIYTGHSNQTIWGGTSTISLITSETGYTNIDTPARMDEFFGDTSVTGRLAVTGAGHFGYTYTTMTAGINVKGDSATTGISIYDGTGTTARIYRKGDILYITRAGNDASGILMSTAGSIYPGANNTLTNGTTTNRWSGVYTQLLNVAGLATTSRILASGEIQSTSAKAFRAIYGSYGFFIYNDGNSSYFLLTNKDDQYGTYNSLRPLAINNSTGAVTMSNGTNIGGILNVTNTTDATTTTAAAIKTAGGLAVAKQLRVGGAATLSSSLYVTGSATFMGGIRIGDYWLRSTADGLELSHATSGKTAGLYATGFLSSMGLNPGTGEGGGGSDYDRLDAWDDYSADKAGYVLSAKLGNDLNTRVKSLEGGSALTVTTTGSGNAVTSVAKSGTAITVTKGTTFVDITNTQTIGGTKTFSSSIRMGQNSLHYLNNASANNATGLYWKTASYAATQFGIGCFTANNASPRGFIGWTSEPWTTSNNLTVSETQLTYKAKNILHAGNYNDYAPTKTGGGASGSWGISITGNAATATTATKLGTATIGAANKPIYLNAGTPTALSSTVGDSTVPAYLNAGTVTACSWGLAGASGKRARKSGYITSSTASLSSYWGKIASFNWGGTSDDRDITLYIHSAFNSLWGTVVIRTRWSSATSTVIDFRIINGNIPTSRLRLYYDVSSKDNAVTLWGDVAGQWGVFNTYVLSETTRTSTEIGDVTLYTTSFTTAQTVPTSTYKEPTYLTIRNNAATSDVADKLGTSTVGSGVKPIYLNAGTATASTSTVGASAKPIFLSSGTLTASSSTIGSGTKPIYMSSGTLTASNSTIGASNQPVFLNAGTITAIGTTIGSETKPVFINGGVITPVGSKITVDINGNATTATTLQTSRTIFGKSFNGSANVAGQALVYGTYQETASSRYSNGGIQVRENGMVGNAQTDDGYAPAIGFHWANRIGASLILTTSGFKFMNQAFTGYQNVYGIFKGNADSATQVYSTLTNPTTGTWYVIPFHSGASTANKSLLNNNGIQYYSLEGTASAQGEALIQIGNSTATGTAGNKRGRLRLYSSSSGWADFTLTATTGNYTLTLPAATGTVALTSSNVASATKLQTARTLWGQSFNGTANVSGSMTGVGPSIVATANLSITTTGENNNLSLKYNNDDTKSVVLNTSAFKPFDLATNKLNLGTSAARWLGLYANTGNFSSTVTGTRFISTVATGTAPLTVSSTTVVTNLNADMVDGIHSSNIPLEYDANYVPTGTAARWLRIAYFDYTGASYSWSGTFTITNSYSNNENTGIIFNVTTRHTTTSANVTPNITQVSGNSNIFTSIRLVKDTSTTYANVYLEVYYNSTSAGNRVYVSYKPANRSIGKWSLYSTYTAGSVPDNHTVIAQVTTTDGFATNQNIRAQGYLYVADRATVNNRLTIQSDGKIVPYSTATRRSGVYGVYDAAKIGHIWSMGSAYQIADDGSTFGSLYGFAYKHTTNTTGGTMASGHQAVWCENGVPKVAIGSNLWVANNATISAVLYTDTLTIKNTEAVAHLKFSRGSYNYITAPASGNITFVVGGQAVGSATAELTIQNGSLIPGTTNATSLGLSSLRWSNTYTQLLNVAGVATLSSTVNIAGVLNANNATDATSTTAAGAVFDGGVGIAKQLRVGGVVTLSSGLSAQYTGSSWITLATRGNIIYGSQNQTEASAHGLYRVKSFAGDAVVFGGLGNAIGFYGFYKARIDAGTNGSDWATTWNTTTGTLTHNKAMTVSGATTLNSTLTVASTGLFNLSTDATSTTAAAVRIVGGLAVGKQLRVGGAVTLSSTLAVTSTSTFTGKTTHNGGIGATTGTFSSTLSAAGVVSFTNATDATSTTAAAVKITGGLGIAKQLRVGGASTFSGTINTSVATFIKLGANATDQKILKDVDGNGFFSGISFFGTKGSNMGVSDIMMNIYAGGAIQIHSQAGSGQILLNGTVHNNVGMYSDGYMSSKGLNDTSDMRLKNKGRDIFLSIKDIARAPAFEYTWKDGTPGEMVGSSAQYWQKVLPPSVKVKKDGYMTMFYGHTALVATISLARHVETLEERVERLERENKEKDKRIKELERRISAWE